MKRKIIKLIFVTGGPCSGKTTGINRAREYLVKHGWTVLVVHEAATLFLTTGMRISFDKKAPKGYLTGVNFQELLIRYQYMIQTIYADAAKHINADKIVILCDRSIIDNQAYIGETAFNKLLKKFNLTKFGILHHGNPASIHMVTAADGAEHAYTLENNDARSEDLVKARKLDILLQNAYDGIGHKTIICNHSDFEVKLKEFIRTIMGILGEPVPLEDERKFLVKLASLNNVKNIANPFRCVIKQDYLRSKQNIAERVRQRGSNGEWVYYHTLKKKIGKSSVNSEKERLIEHALFQEMLLRKDDAYTQIHKDRYCFTHDYQYFEFDMFKNPTTSFDKKKEGILEIELTDQNSELSLPSYIDIIEEVTGKKAFDNKEIARIAA